MISEARDITLYHASYKPVEAIDLTENALSKIQFLEACEVMPK